MWTRNVLLCDDLQKYLQQLWDTVLLVVLILCTGVLVQARWQNQDHQLNDDLEVLSFFSSAPLSGSEWVLLFIFLSWITFEQIQLVFFRHIYVWLESNSLLGLIVTETKGSEDSLCRTAAPDRKTCLFFSKQGIFLFLFVCLRKHTKNKKTQQTPLPHRSVTHT